MSSVRSQTEKRTYSREFLLSFQYDTSAMEKPKGLEILEAFHNHHSVTNPVPIPNHFSHNPYVGFQGSPQSHSHSVPSSPQRNVPSSPPSFGTLSQSPKKTIDRTPVELPNKAEHAWGSERPKLCDIDEQSRLLKKIRGTLNKLTPEKYPRFLPELTDRVILQDQTILTGLIQTIFENSVRQPQYADMYGRLCHDICSAELEMITDATGEPTSQKLSNFRKLILSRCQDEFESRDSSESKPENWSSMSEPEKSEWLLKKRQRKNGNINFVGELYKQAMLTERIIRVVINILLHDEHTYQALDNSDDYYPEDEELELLCKLLIATGVRLDASPGDTNEFLTKLYERIETFSTSCQYPKRLQFMCADILDLRKLRWKPRK